MKLQEAKDAPIGLSFPSFPRSIRRGPSVKTSPISVVDTSTSAFGSLALSSSKEGGLSAIGTTFSSTWYFSLLMEGLLLPGDAWILNAGKRTIPQEQWSSDTHCFSTIAPDYSIDSAGGDILDKVT